MKVKKVCKYETGDNIPEGAVYLSTQTEVDERKVDQMGFVTQKRNVLVWHYFLLEVED